MADLDRLFQPSGADGEPAIVAVEVTRPPDDPTSPLTVQSLHDGTDYDAVWWMPRGSSAPARGDKGVAVIDDNGDAWLAVWHPVT